MDLGCAVGAGHGDGFAGTGVFADGAPHAHLGLYPGGLGQQALTQPPGGAGEGPQKLRQIAPHVGRKFIVRDAQVIQTGADQLHILPTGGRQPPGLRCQQNGVAVSGQPHDLPGDHIQSQRII